MRPVGRGAAGGERGREADSGPLERALRAAVRGDVLFDLAHRAMYTTDASNYRAVPTGVVRPRDPADVEAAIAVCRDHGAAILPRGAGTSIAGQACNVAVVLDFTRHMRHIVGVDPDRRVATVEPGVILDDLQRAAGAHGLRFGPDPSSHDRCTIGGMIGNNACGAHSLTWGTTIDATEALDVVLYDGTSFTADAERVMAPAIRAAPDDALVLADGFSCRTQVEHTTGRRALHLAEAVRMSVER